MTQFRPAELSALSTPLVMRRAADAYLVISFLYITLNGLLDYISGGNSWKQGDWLINNAGGEIRRGYFGSAIIEISDYFGSSPLFIVILIQLFVLLLLFYSFRLLIKPAANSSISILLLISPAIFTVFWVADPQGSMRKELLSFAGLSLCALASMRESRSIFWLGVFLLCVSFISHEAMVLFVPTFFGILLISRFHQKATGHALVASVVVVSVSLFSLFFAIQHSQVSDIERVCAPLLDRGLEHSICDGAIEWLNRNSAFGFQNVINTINAKSLGGALIAYAFALAPFVYIAKISTQPVRNGIILVLAALPFVPLYFIAVDWGRWMSFHIFSVNILLACAMGENRFQLNRIPSNARILSLVAISLAFVPQHTIGIIPGGVFRRAAAEFLRIFS